MITYDLTSRVFGEWTVLHKGPSHTFPSGAVATQWYAKCSCGQIKLLKTQMLTSGQSTRCKNCSPVAPLAMGLSAMRLVLGMYKRNAESRGLEFCLTEDEFRQLTSEPCYYCGEPPSKIKRSNASRGSYIHNGIDRVDNGKGYTMSNCVACCEICNKSKMTQTKEEFLAWVAKVYKHSLQS